MKQKTQKISLVIDGSWISSESNQQEQTICWDWGRPIEPQEVLSEPVEHSVAHPPQTYHICKHAYVWHVQTHLKMLD